MTLSAEVIVGTYEDYVVGYSVVTQPQPKAKRFKENGSSSAIDNQQYCLEQSFAVRLHSGSVQCLTASSNGALVVSAGFDEVVNLLDLKKRKLLQTIDLPIKCASFVDSTHLILGSEDGKIYIYERKNSSIELVKTLIGHKHGITSLSVHPSGKVLLSISKDSTMRTWNLIKGRIAYVTSIKSNANLVSWSRTGEQFVIGANNEIYLYSSGTGLLEHKFELDKRIHSIEFISDNTFVVTSDSNELEFFNLKKKISTLKHRVHEARVKGIKFIDKIGERVMFATSSSDGVVKLWSYDETTSSPPEEMAQADLGARVTCLTGLSC